MSARPPPNATPVAAFADLIIEAGTRAAMEAALARLAHDEREALILRKIDGLSPHEIGAHLGISARQVQRLIASALAQCQASLTQGEHAAPEG